MRQTAIFLSGFLTLTTLFAFGQGVNKDIPPPSKRTIVFVCEHGAGRSPIAAAYFNQLAKERNLNYQATCRGIVPDSTVGPAIQTGLRKDGFDITGWKPILLSNTDVENAHMVVTLDCVLPRNHSIVNTRPWSDIPISKSYTEARDAIVNKLQPLILGLLKEDKHKN